MNMKKNESRQELLNRAFIYVLFIGISVIIFLRVKPLLFDLFVAVVLAALAEPVVYRLSKKFGRKISALISVALLLLVIFGIIFSLIPIMVQEIYYISTQLPTYLDNLLDYFNREGFTISNQSLDLESQFSTFVNTYGGTVGETVVFAGQGVLSALGHFFIIFFFSFYLISEGEHWRENLKKNIAPKYSNLIEQVWTIGVSKAGGFIVARVILGILASIVFTVSFLVIGLPSAVALGIAAGVLSQLIPVIGTFLGGIVPVLASISLGVNYVLYTLIVLSVYQLIENYFISPKVTQSTMEIHPAVAVFSTIFGAYTVGAVGAILALPVAATIQGVVGTIIENSKNE
jgi:predicted PurR-regulated permease PerM|tara:strand:- start:2516 stop:3550 length:1035 start_codon:yes stop_codon:yes gene_type:complete